MSAIYGRVGKSTSPGFRDLFETEYKKKCRIDSYSFQEKANEYTASFGECLQYITAESKKEALPISSGNLLFTADAILDNRAYVTALIAKKASSEELSALSDGSLMFKLLEIDKASAKHFLGIYSYALYDEKEQRLTLAADPVASRCLYYYQDDSQVVFSTILAPLLRWCPDTGISAEYLKDYLGAPGLMPNILSDISPFRNIYMVNPGSQVHFDFSAHGIKKTEEFYIDWTTGRGIIDGAIGSFEKRSNPSDYLRDFRRIYSQCVADACRSNENVAMSLSSGFDSASVAVFAAKALEAKGNKLFTYTYVPYEKPAEDRNKNNIHNEAAPVKELGTMYPNMVQEFVNNEGRNCVAQLQDITDILEIPIKAVANMPSLFEIFQKAREKNCRIVMTGQTGNASVSCGYIDHVLFDLYLNHRYIKMLRYLMAFSKDVGESRKAAIKGVFAMFKAEKKQLQESIRGECHIPPQLYDWVRPEAYTDYDLVDRFKKSGMTLTKASLNYRKPAREFLTSKACHSYLGGYETKAGLHHGVVLRDPTRDPRIIWFCYNLPFHLFAYKGRTRWLIREGLKDMLPATITKNQIRYGVQNSDCGNRLLRDAVSVNELMEKQKTNADANAPADLSVFYDTKKMSKLPVEENATLPQSMEVELLTAFGLLSFINNNI